MNSSDPIPIRETVLALHGFIGTPHDFDPLIQATRYCFWHTPTLPGHQMAPLIPFQNFLDTIHALTLREKLSPYILLGYSMGGRIALHYAIQNPSHIKAIVLIGASPGIENSAERIQRQKEDRHLAKTIQRKDIYSLLSFWQQKPIIHSQANIPPSIRNPMTENRLQHDPVKLGQALIEFGTGYLPSLWNQLSTIDCPTLLLTGEQDSKFSTIAQEMCTRLKNARHFKLPQAGHMAHLENHVAFLNVFTAFLQSL